MTNFRATAFEIGSHIVHCVLSDAGGRHLHKTFPGIGTCSSEQTCPPWPNRRGLTCRK